MDLVRVRRKDGSSYLAVVVGANPSPDLRRVGKVWTYYEVRKIESDGSWEAMRDPDQAPADEADTSWSTRAGAQGVFHDLQGDGVQRIHVVSVTVRLLN